jgi:hypothetical protein
MIILSALEVPCPSCKAEPGERCTYVAQPRYRGQIMRYGSHGARTWDADDASRVANILVGE